MYRCNTLDATFEIRKIDKSYGIKHLIEYCLIISIMKLKDFINLIITIQSYTNYTKKANIEVVCFVALKARFGQKTLEDDRQKDS